ncbi:MAG: hypothetical protein ACYDG4_04250 [Desulfuromonadaceae bacterium]
MIRVFIPENQASSFIEFFNQKNREPSPIIRKASPLRDEAYFIKRDKSAVKLYESFLSKGLPAKTSISETLKLLKSGEYFNISYDSLKQILTKNGCFRAKFNEKSLT